MEYVYSNGTIVYGFFDPKEYLKLNIDVAASGTDPLQHYLTIGKKESRQLPLIPIQQYIPPGGLPISGLPPGG